MVTRFPNRLRLSVWLNTATRQWSDLRKHRPLLKQLIWCKVPRVVSFRTPPFFVGERIEATVVSGTLSLLNLHFGAALSVVSRRRREVCDEQRTTLARPLTRHKLLRANSRYRGWVQTKGVSYLLGIIVAAPFAVPERQRLWVGEVKGRLFFSLSAYTGDMKEIPGKGKRLEAWQRLFPGSSRAQRCTHARNVEYQKYPA